MDRFKLFFENHYGESVELKYRMFCICASLGTLTSLCGFLLCAFMAGVFSLIGLGTLFGFLLMLSLTIYGVHSRKTELISIIMSVFLNLGVFPLTFIGAGALYSVAPLFFIMGILIAVPLTNGKRRSILFFIEFVAYCVLIALCYLFPELSVARAQSEHTTMLLFSFIIVAFYLYTSTWMIVRHYEMERSKSEGLNYQLSQLVIRDPLTQLYNRRYLMDFLERRFLDKEKTFAVAIIDIDDFKKINDTFGHSFGDKVLVKLSAIMKECMHGKGFVSRYGGEEFIVYYDSNQITDFVSTLVLMKTKFKEYFLTEHQMEVSFSAGVVSYDDEESIVALFDKADALLYEAKSNQKDEIRFK